MKKPFPDFKTDEEAERFVATADLSEYDLSGQFVRFELRRKDDDSAPLKPNAETIEAMREAERGDTIKVGKLANLITSLN